MVCLDSDLLIAVLRKDKTALAMVSDLGNNGEKLTTTPVNATELFEGATMSGRRDSLESVETIVASLELLSFDTPAARLAGDIIGKLKLEGRQIDNMDALIGAIALSHGEALVTRNIKHFERIKGLRIEKW